MKKFTLLAGAALLAGSGAFAADPAEVNGLKISNDTQKFYYRISNMRAQRMSYITALLYGEDGYTEDDVIGSDSAIVTQHVNLPDTMAGGVATPEIFSFPYMGLSNLDNNWWVGFSAMSEVLDPNTTYWYFTYGGRPGSVQIHNAVMDGTIKRASEQVTGIDGTQRPTMGFDLKGENRYYVIPAMEGPGEGLGIKDQDWAENLALNDAQKASAFALSTTPTYSTTSNSCLDMNNYISYTTAVQKFDEDGNPINNDKGEPTYNYYGFAGVDRTWSPIRTTGGEKNINHYANNGSLFFVERSEDPVTGTDAAAEIAIKEYADVIAAGFRKGAVEGAKKNFVKTINILKGWSNVPMLWRDEAALNAIITYCSSWNGEGLDVEKVHNLETRLAYEAEAQVLADKKLAEAAALIGKGAVVTLRNQLAYRDINDWLEAENNDPEANQKLQLGDAYITAGGIGTCLLGNDTLPLEYDGIVPTLEKDENGKSEWTLEHVEGTPYFLLFNAATGTYIRQYKEMFELAGGEDELGAESEVREFSWATTENKEEAAPFMLEGCADPDRQAQITEDEMIVMDDANIEYGVVTNNVRLNSSYEKVTPAENEGEEPTVSTEYTYIHRGSKASYYKFINWSATKNWWFCDTNIFNVDLVKEGGINEIAAEGNKANAIYDLQGRRVSKAGKGIYIVNGVKTLVR